MTKTYSDAVLVEGPLIFVSGQTPDTFNHSAAAGDAAEQVRQVFRNVEGALAEHGADLRHLVKLTYYLRHATDLEAIDEVAQEFLVHEPRPVATVVEVSGFVDARHLVQLDAVARLPRGDRSIWVS
ncbi:2-iminobutanoate/2-iminopropanoate deaminase [Lipingzhangella halophila]|uniref:2-iminobutanoate/2-iminopropanoate deaminase n=1 Tax=Lipingzhangella halophila TaxID=1783352 RepID=A0A7W7RK80_9ACTN|nr:RidA family protein [Lipingzhangella halophila]MBB4933543.1 2-iminobutanoate/2-iminopropanoate deaminase [Lipingzhangella halophila]